MVKSFSGMSCCIVQQEVQAQAVDLEYNRGLERNVSPGLDVHKIGEDDRAYSLDIY